jgi:hypothetical protein
MNRFHRPPGLPMLAVTLLVAWIAVAALLGAPAEEAMPFSATPVPAAAVGSDYPAPQVDASAPIAEPSPTF